jgi:uncharacterized protein
VVPVADDDRVGRGKEAAIRLRSPAVLAGFPDNGMIGSICINHLIEQAQMHQIAYVDSQYIMASALFVGKKLRHPFRVYANPQGTVCAILCEVPILARGIRSIVNAIVDWCDEVKAADVTVLGGIAPTNISPSAFQSPRSAFVLQNVQGDAATAGGLAGLAGGAVGQAGLAGDSGSGKSSSKPLIRVPTTAFVVGIGGALLSSCVANGIMCRGLFVPSLGEAPDPGGAALLLDALGELVPAAKVSTESLQAEAEMIRRQLEELLKMQQSRMQEYERASEGGGATSRPETERIYK